MDEYKSAPEVVHHGALLGACYMVDLLQDTEQPAKLRLDVAAQLYDRAYGRPPIAGALLDAGGVYTVEEFNPDPFLDALDKYGLPRSENHDPVLVD